MPTPPAPDLPPEPDPATLAGKVLAALYALPPQFKSDLNISGVRATDLFTFNASLGATIEEQVVDALNALRTSTWDQDEQFAQYRFVCQPQTFPDVVLRAAAPGITPEILFGIELKGWYVLAKEREPSFRYRVTPAVCAPDDLLAVSRGRSRGSSRVSAALPAPRHQGGLRGRVPQLALEARRPKRRTGRRRKRVRCRSQLSVESGGDKR